MFKISLKYLLLFCLIFLTSIKLSKLWETQELVSFDNNGLNDINEEFENNRLNSNTLKFIFR